jgi:hypothetical protein
MGTVDVLHPNHENIVCDIDENQTPCDPIPFHIKPADILETYVNYTYSS